MLTLAGAAIKRLRAQGDFRHRDPMTLDT